MALATPRSWVRFPGKARADKNVETVTRMHCKLLWIKASAKCINVNVTRFYRYCRFRVEVKVSCIHLVNVMHLYRSQFFLGC